MNIFLRVLLAGVFAATLLAGCNKSDDAVDNMKEEVSEAVDATKEAAGAVAEEAKEEMGEAVDATKEAATEAKEEAADAVEAAKKAAADATK